MKALSLRQPWIWAMFDLGKNIENRRWVINHRSPLLLHAALGCSPKERTLALRFIHAATGDLTVRIPPTSQLQRGGIVGRFAVADPHLPGEQRGRWHMPGQYGHPVVRLERLVTAEGIPTTIPYRGRLGLFDVPDELIAEALPGHGWQVVPLC